MGRQILHVRLVKNPHLERIAAATAAIGGDFIDAGKLLDARSECALGTSAQVCPGSA